MIFTLRTPIPLISPSLHSCPLPLKSPSQKKKKLKKNLTVEAEMCHSVSHSIPFCPNSFTCKCSESFVWFKASGFCYTFNTRSSLGLLWNILLSCHVSWRSCSSGSAGPDVSWTPAVHRWGRCWSNTTQTLDVGLGGS